MFGTELGNNGRRRVLLIQVLPSRNVLAREMGHSRQPEINGADSNSGERANSRGDQKGPRSSAGL